MRSRVSGMALTSSNLIDNEIVCRILPGASRDLLSFRHPQGEGLLPAQSTLLLAGWRCGRFSAPFNRFRRRADRRRSPQFPMLRIRQQPPSLPAQFRKRREPHHVLTILKTSMALSLVATLGLAGCGGGGSGSQSNMMPPVIPTNPMSPQELRLGDGLTIGTQSLICATTVADTRVTRHGDPSNKFRAYSASLIRAKTDPGTRGSHDRRHRPIQGHFSR